MNADQVNMTAELGEMSDKELFLASVQGNYDDDAQWDAVHELRLRNTEAVFLLAAAYCKSELPIERARGLDVLAQLGAGHPEPERIHVGRSLDLALDGLSDDDGQVVSSAAWALSHLGGDRAVTALIAERANADAFVRWGVACGMAGSQRQDAIETLTQLMEDSDEEVRDWATFALGKQCSADSAEIQLALRQRLNDSSVDVRNEALWGLCLRKDREALAVLLSRLRSEQWLSGDEMAAADTLQVDSDTPIAELCAGIEKLL